MIMLQIIIYFASAADILRKPSTAEALDSCNEMRMD